MPSQVLTSTLGCPFLQTCHFRGVISPFDLILDFLHTWAVCDWPVNASWCAGHSGYMRHSRRSYSRSRRTAWPAPPSCSYAVCPGSFHLRLVDCRVLCCRSVPVQVWYQNHIRGCAFCLMLDTVPPSSVGLFHKNVSTRSTPL